MPEGIVITFGKEMMQANGGQRAMMKLFLDTMADGEGYWMHKMILWPKKRSDRCLHHYNE